MTCCAITSVKVQTCDRTKVTDWVQTGDSTQKRVRTCADNVCHVFALGARKQTTTVWFGSLSRFPFSGLVIYRFSCCSSGRVMCTCLATRRNRSKGLFLRQGVATRCRCAIRSIHELRIRISEDSSRFLISRGGTPRSTGISPEIWSQPCLVCGLLVCRLTVLTSVVLSQTTGAKELCHRNVYGPPSAGVL